MAVGSPVSVLSFHVSCLHCSPLTVGWLIVRADVHTGSLLVPGGIDWTLRNIPFMVDGHRPAERMDEEALGAWSVRWEGFKILMLCRRMSNVICMRLERLCVCMCVNVCVFHNLRRVSAWHIHTSEERRTGVKWIVSTGRATASHCF